MPAPDPTLGILLLISIACLAGIVVGGLVLSRRWLWSLLIDPYDAIERVLYRLIGRPLPRARPHWSGSSVGDRAAVVTAFRTDGSRRLGKVRAHGEIWWAVAPREGEDLAAGATCRVVARQGMYLHVVPDSDPGETR